MTGRKQLILALVAIVAVMALSGFTRTTKEFTTQGQRRVATCLYYWGHQCGLCTIDWHPDD